MESLGEHERNEASDSPSPWMQTREVVAYLRVSEATVYRWVQEGRLAAYGAGRVRRYKREDVEAVLKRIEPGGDGEQQ